MNHMVLGGSVDSALAHLALVGVALILEDAGHSAALRWSDEDRPRPILRTGLSENEVARAVREHAEAHARPDSWVMRDEPRSGLPTYAVRAKWPEGRDWLPLLDDRAGARPLGESGWLALDNSFLATLGEPAWWREVEKGTADAGASRWEMKTRNRGAEFFTDRFRRLAVEVAAWPDEQIHEGLTGRATRDVVGKQAADSRTSTGLSSPGPTDNAVAWCALWGLATMSLERRRGGVSDSSGVWPRSETHPVRAALPVFVQAVTPRTYRGVLASASFDMVAVSEAEAVATRDLSWLQEQGVLAIVRFPIKKGGSASAPERFLLKGEVQVL